MKNLKTFENFKEIQTEDENGFVGYFVCDRYRNWLNIDYCKKFYKKGGVKTHKTFKSAYNEMRNGFYDDSEYHVVGILKNGEMEILRDVKKYL